ncbi:MAG: glutaredoxin 3 [Gammaproteobacteria bacterium]|nr:MAG: glutaredoxin 3 [Gammaproteobacteria bacterium]
MDKIEIYTKNFCPYCTRAKALLDKMGLIYTEYELSFDSARETEMIRRSGRFTVPQIFVDNTPIGGSDELYELVENDNFYNLLNPSTGAINLKQEIVNYV